MRLVSQRRLDDLTNEARTSTRRRKNFNVHGDLSDCVQRLYNAMEPGTYVRPHRHTEPGKWELFFAPRGAIAALVFDTDGCVTGRVEIGANRDYGCVEIPANTWHTIVALESGSIMFEVKPGPYSPLGDKDFAEWAPGEGDEHAVRFEVWSRTAAVGDRVPAWR